jgi:hypothetical protein
MNVCYYSKLNFNFLFVSSNSLLYNSLFIIVNVTIVVILPWYNIRFALVELMWPVSWTQV